MPTIALVDDDRNILTSVSIALEAVGYRINTYADGVSALVGFQTAPPDLAILDIKMPRMDGMETLRRLRQKSDLPVILLTSKEEEMDELFGLKMGADDFIRKRTAPRRKSWGGIARTTSAPLSSIHEIRYRPLPSSRRPYNVRLSRDLSPRLMRRR